MLVLGLHRYTVLMLVLGLHRYIVVSVQVVVPYNFANQLIIHPTPAALTVQTSHTVNAACPPQLNTLC